MPMVFSPFVILVGFWLGCFTLSYCVRFSVATRAPPRSLRLLVSQYYAHVFVLLSDSLRSSISLASLLHRHDNSSALEKSSERSQSFLKEFWAHWKARTTSDFLYLW